MDEIYICIYWFGLPWFCLVCVLYHVNPCGSFNAKSCVLYIYVCVCVCVCVCAICKWIVDRYYYFWINQSLFIYTHLVGKVFASGPEDRGSIPGRVIPETLKVVHDTSLLNTQHYNVRIKGKVEQFRERSSALPYTSV